MLKYKIPQIVTLTRNTFSQEDATDGIILKEPVKWKVSPK